VGSHRRGCINPETRAQSQRKAKGQEEGKIARSDSRDGSNFIRVIQECGQRLGCRKVDLGEEKGKRCEVGRAGALDMASKPVGKGGGIRGIFSRNLGHSGRISNSSTKRRSMVKISC